MFKPTAITLSTDKIILRPLTMAHLDDFYLAGAYPELWKWSLPDQCTSKAQSATWLAYSEKMTQQAEHIAFAIFDKQSGELVGSTRYCAISTQDKTLEVGFTFITPKYQRSYVNTHAKYCLLKHAFEQLGAIRVQFKAHEDNTKSRNAIKRLGATFEGILRHHRILSDGSFRNTAIFSIINHEWPSVKAQLTVKL